MEERFLIQARMADHKPSSTDAEQTVRFDRAEAMDLSSACAASGSPGSKATRYQIEGEVARGGMGVIYRVRDADLSRILAMKVMRPGSGSSDPGEGTSPGSRARFLEEAQITAQLDHPGVVPVHELGIDEKGQPFFTMKLVEGRNLGQIFELARAGEQGWNLPRAVGTLVKAAQALGYAHEKGVIHRDLKPANIMVGRFGEVYVMDWGLAKLRGTRDLHDVRPRGRKPEPEEVGRKGAQPDVLSTSTPLMTMDGSIIGTPAYMPPEQAAGQVNEVDATSDIYSLGAILYHLLAGHPPYFEHGARLAPHTILAKVLDGPPRKIQEVNSGAPGELGAICEKAMARQKQHRYQSSLELAEELQAFLDGRVVRAYQTGAWAELKAWIRRNRTTAIAGAAAVLIVLSISVLNAARERRNAVRLKHSLAAQLVKRGLALCESGERTKGLHWLARAWNEAPESSGALREVIEENLAAWSRDMNSPLAVLRNDNVIYSTVYDPSGTRIATTGIDSTIRLWTLGGESAGAPMRHEGSITSLSFSPDNKLLLSTSVDQTARLWRTESSAAVGGPMRHGGEVLSGDFSPDGRQIATGSVDDTAIVWSIASQMQVHPPLEHGDDVTSVQFSRDGQSLLTASRDNLARLWRLEAGNSPSIVMDHGEPVLAARFSPDGRLVWSQTAKAIHFWSSETGERVGESVEHGEYILATALSQDGKVLATAGVDSIVRLWSVDSRQPIRSAISHADPVRAVALSPDGKTILTGSDDRTARLWSVERETALSPPIVHSDRLSHLAFHPDGKSFLTQPHGEVAIVWSIRSAEGKGIRLEAAERARCFVFNPAEGKLIGGSPGSILQWSVESGRLAKPPVETGAFVWALALSPDNQLLLSAQSDNTAQLRVAKTGEPIGVSLRHDAEVRAVAFSPDGKLAATGSFDHSARTWSVANGQETGAALVHPNFVEEVLFTRDGAGLLTACSDGAARLWSLQTRSLLLPPLRHQGAVLAAAVSPDGSRLVTGGRDHLVRFWEMRTGKPVGQVLEHRGWVEDICFSQDGKRLWTLTPRELRVWDMQTGEPIGPALPTPGSALDLALSDDGTRLAFSGSRRISETDLGLSRPTHGSLATWVQALTFTEMDAHGAVRWLDNKEREERGRLLTNRAD